MLRTVLIAVGGFCMLCGLVALAAGLFPPAAVFAFWGAVLVLGIVCERVIYKPIAAARPGPGWERTSERFVDEASGQMVTVYIEPGTGERAYIRE
ncbi:MAG TPA: hypothetical protein VNU97_07355 [Rhizomicrobium sp.]|nr:hypothetical protein [Rhizomicrobium sp.]